MGRISGRRLIKSSSSLLFNNSLDVCLSACACAFVYVYVCVYVCVHVRVRMCLVVKKNAQKSH